MRFRWCPAIVALLAAACAQHAPVTEDTAIPPYGATELAETPFFPQQEYQCGPAALATVLRHSGIPVTPDDLVPGVYLPERRGSLQAELIAASRHYQRLPYIIEPALAALLAELDAGHPVLVLQNTGLPHFPVWHYAVVIGYQPSAGALILRSGQTRRRSIEVNRFAKTWAASGNWAMIVLEPGELPANPDSKRYLRAVAAMEELGRFDDAARGYQAAVGRWPASATAWLGLGNTRYHAGKLAAAETAFRRALAIDTRNAFARNNLALTLARRGCFADALATIDRAVKAASGPDEREMLLQTRQEINALRHTGDGNCQPPVTR